MADADAPSQLHDLPPSVRRAARWNAVLGGATWSIGAVGIGLAVVAAVTRAFGELTLGSTLALPAAAALVAFSGLLAAVVLGGARARVAEAADAAQVARQQRAAAAARAGDAAAPQALFSAGDDPDLLVQAERARVLRLAGWPQALSSLPWAVIAAVLLVWAWPVAGVVPGGFAIAAGLLVAAFPVLLLERRLALAADEDAAVRDLPEAAGLARLVRLLLWTLVVAGAVALARSLGAGFTIWLLWPAAILVLLAAGETALRSGAAPFLPTGSLSEARGLGDATLAGLLLPRLGAGAGAAQGLKDRFGIDLSQSWALRFVRRVSAPLLVVLVVLGWLLSGITSLSLSERGVYQRLGAPVAVLPSGLHLHLPWPFGVVRRLEAGAVHELAVGAAEDAKLERSASDSTDTTPFDRIWNKEHAADAIYLVPGGADAAGVAQASQVLNSDVRVFYRIGLDDASARAALYGLATPLQTVRAAARRQLARVFATRPLMGAMGEDRAQLGAAVRSALQAELDRAGSGLEIVAVAVDSIHPPQKAAAAYHGVQEATIVAQREVADARRNSTVVLSEKHIEATVARANAAWLAATRVAEARVDTRRFAAEAEAWRVAPRALALERWLQVLGKGLSRAKIDIIDHRIELLDGPVLDMRRFATPAETSP